MIPARELRVSFARSSGAGGQNVNKVNSKAILRWGVARSPSLPEGVRRRFLERHHRRINSQGVLVISSDRYRDQSRNVDDCRQKLSAMLAEAAEIPAERIATQPTPGSTTRRLDAKRAHAGKKRQRRLPRSEEDTG